jgi:hypothetical protein
MAAASHSMVATAGSTSSTSDAANGAFRGFLVSIMGDLVYQLSLLSQHQQAATVHVCNSK